MSVANFGAFRRNVGNIAKAYPLITGGFFNGLNLEAKVKARAEKFAPEDYKIGYEKFTPTTFGRQPCEVKNLWVDTKWGDDGNPRQDLVDLWYFRTDRWRAFHWQFLPLAFGGNVWLAAQAYALANDSWLPSAFRSVDAESKKAWYDAQDLLRYKYTPGFLNMNKFLFEWSFPAVAEKWEDVHEKNDVRRNPEWARDVAKFYAKYYPLHVMKRRVAYGLLRTMGSPSWPMMKKAGACTRFRDIYELTFTEDVMVIKQNLLQGMTDDELFDYCWRRYLTPRDKNLSRQDMLTRANDYHKFLGPEILDGKHPGLVGTHMYLIGYYNDPAFLENDISDLDKDDYTHMASWTRDLFQKRLEFENGPLRDQIEAHVVAQKAKQEARLAELKKIQE